MGRRVIAVLVLVAGVAAVWEFQPQPEPAPGSGYSSPSEQRTAGLPAPERVSAPEATNSADAASTAARLGPTLTNAAVATEPAEWAELRTYTTDEYRSKLIGDRLVELDLEQLPVYQRLAAEGDAEAAYLLYLRYTMCKSAPRSEQELEQAVAFWQGIENDQVNVDHFINNDIANFEICQDFTGDLERQAFAWFTRATELGHLIAQIDYPAHVPAFLLHLAIREPGMIERYRAVAMEGMNQALRSGHVDAFNAWAKQYLDGNLMDRDPLQAYVWAHVADLAAHGDNENALAYQKIAEAELSPAQVRQARSQARELCERYCR